MKVTAHVAIAVAAVLGGLVSCPRHAGADSPPKEPPKVFVPYSDLAAIVDPAARAVLMDRAEFDRLLAEARANVAAAPGVLTAQVLDARYTADVTGQNIVLAGQLLIACTSDKPVAMPLPFGQMGLTELTLDGKPAPLGQDDSGRLVLVIAGRGEHQMTMAGAAALKDLAGGGTQFGLSLPTAVAGAVKLSAPGDLEVRSTAPVQDPRYDKPRDRTTAELAIGGHAAVTVLLLGNGRQEDQRAILLAESATSVQVNPTHQVLNCVQTVQVLRRSVRELRFSVPGGWTVSDVACANLVKWSIEPGADGAGEQVLVIQLTAGSRNELLVHIRASAPITSTTAWSSPRVALVGADFQRGYLVVDAGEHLRIRGHKLTDARQEDPSPSAAALRVLGAPVGQLFYHWGDKWSVRLDLTAVALRRGSEDRQSILAGPEQIALTGQFQITPTGREMYDVSFELPSRQQGWELTSVDVPGYSAAGPSPAADQQAQQGQPTVPGFQYHLADLPGKRLLRIELSRPVRAEGVVAVVIALRHVPADWNWANVDAPPPRQVAVPIIRPVADTVSSVVSVAAAGDLDVAAVSVPAALAPVNVGRMVTLGLGSEVIIAYTAQAVIDQPLKLEVSRRSARLAADSVGLVELDQTRLAGHWRINYRATRADVQTLYLLADRSLGQTIEIESPGRRLASRRVVQPGPRTVALAEQVAGAWDLWQLTLDNRAGGTIPIHVRYTRPPEGAEVRVPLIRPAGVAQATEMLALQVSEELAVVVSARAAGEIDTIELPTLPAPARRLLAAFRLEAVDPARPEGPGSQIVLKTTAHGPYGVPSAIISSIEYTTRLGPVARGAAQQTEALLGVVNAGLQFLPIRLPADSELWSVRVGDEQAKPKRDAAGDYLVALPRSAEPLAVQVVYAARDPRATVERIQLAGLTFPSVQVNSIRWTVVPPPGCRVRTETSRMQLEGGQAEPPVVLGPPRERVSATGLPPRIGQPARPACFDFLSVVDHSMSMVERARCLPSLSMLSEKAGRRADGEDGETAWKELTERRGPYAIGLPPEDPANQRVRELMLKVVPEIRFNNITFENALNYLRDLQRVNINPNWGAMEALGITKNTEVTLQLRDVTFETALRELLAKVAGREDMLDYMVREGVVKVSTRDDLASLKYVLVYDVRDLVRPLTDFAVRRGDIARQQAAEEYRQAKVDSFMNLIRSTALPDTWAPTGDANITETDGLLVIKQTANGHRELAKLLTQLRGHTRRGEGKVAEELEPDLPAKVSRDDIRRMSRLYTEDRTGLAGGDAFFGAPATQPEVAAAPPAPPARLRPESAVTAEGRHTLPVELLGGPGDDFAVTFIGLDPGPLVIGLTSESRLRSWWYVGFTAVALYGLMRVKARPGRKLVLIFLALAVSTLVAVVKPAAAAGANGVFYGGLVLVPFYLVAGVVRLATRRIRRRRSRRAAAAPRLAGAATVAILLIVQAGALAGEAADQPSSPDKTAPPEPPFVVPYDGDPTQADRATKVLVPYSRFVELWNTAHPDRPIEVALPANGISLADVRYDAVLEPSGGPAEPRLLITLTAQVRTLGERWVTLPMPMQNLALTEATLEGQPVRLDARPNGLALLLRGRVSGQLRLIAVATPRHLGRKGSIDLVLPPLPAAVMTVRLPEADLVLEAPNIEGALTSRPAEKGVEWTIPLNLTANLSLRWAPKVAPTAADKTLSAVATHDLHAFHWGLVGVSKLNYSFSAGDYDRFGVLLPDGATLTEISGANLRDHRVVGDATIEGVKFRTVEVRLHRPAVKQYELTCRWVIDPATAGVLGKPGRLPLVQAAEVGRESGTVTLHAAGGIAIRVAEVAGGRRAAEDVRTSPQPARPAEATEPVARYQWPYRPFALQVELARLAVAPTVAINQLVRVNTDKAQLLVQARLTASTGQFFAAHFALPDGYEVLNVAGPTVGEWHIQPTPAGRLLHVPFRSGATQAELTVVLVRNDPALDRFAVPMLTATDPDGRPLADQTGRLAVQVAPALDAQTVASENLKPLAPAELGNWLGSDQLAAVQFACRYDKPVRSLTLAVRPKPSKVRVEIIGGVTVQATWAAYAWLLRYTVDGSPIDRVSFTLPARYGPLVAVSSPALRGVSQADAGNGLVRWTVALVSEVTGVLDVNVNFAVPIDAATSALPVPRVDTDAPEGYRAVIAVQNLSRHELAVAAKANLADLPVAEQAKLLPDPIRASLQYVFEAFKDDWALDLALTRARPAARVQAVVDLMHITTVIDRQGACRYEVLLTLQNRSEQFLRLRLPAGFRLWSAIVADEPVKPVLDPAAPDQVLIPLVKTSPGGLPYDVRLYLAGQGTARLTSRAAPGPTRLAPPPVAVANIQVMRTTWSVRLPAGYYYYARGGNMTAVAGVTEILTIENEARLEQLKRFEQSVSLDLQGNQTVEFQTYAQDNWKAFNDRLAQDIARNNALLISNAGNLTGETFEQLKGKLADLGNTQYALQGLWDRRQQDIQQAGANNFNTFTGGLTINGGLLEIDRNRALHEIPQFVTDANKRQQELLAGELKNVTEGGFAYGGVDGGGAVTKSGDGTLLLTDAKKAPGKPAEADAAKLLADEDGRRPEKAARMLEEVRKENYARQQARLTEQMNQLQDQRLGRYYQADGVETRVIVPDRGTVNLGGQVGGAGTQFFGSAASPRQPTVGTAGRLVQPQATPAPPAGPAPDTRMPLLQLNVAGDAQMNQLLVSASERRDRDAEGVTDKLAQPTGAFSLPVELPEAEGQVQLDFAHPSGQPELVIWAVDARIVTAATGGGVIVGVLVVLWLLGRLWRRIRSKRAASSTG